MKIYEITNYDVTPEGTATKYNHILYVANTQLVVEFLAKHHVTMRMGGSKQPITAESVANEWFVKPAETHPSMVGDIDYEEQRYFVREIEVKEKLNKVGV